MILLAPPGGTGGAKNLPTLLPEVTSLASNARSVILINRLNLGGVEFVMSGALTPLSPFTFSHNFKTDALRYTYDAFMEQGLNYNRTLSKRL